MYIRTSVAATWSVLLLAMQGQFAAARDPKELEGTLKATKDAATDLITKFLNAYSPGMIACDKEYFKAQVVTANALCQLQGDSYAKESCQIFGTHCFLIPSLWGCGTIEGSTERGCFPRVFEQPPGGKEVPKVKFDYERGYDWYNRRLY
ncbi:hypothetical protein DFQ27_006767 [Actinomortierella ambigua]|uniref:Uncharacterized protein n=1 Tax=Actinomortierella ambigua TaxID=1343610 RepID=A0A9P6QJY5_9FUNG|nr:hypothetical protein DFQ27_006767 [Actinomortierella ambigua]